MIINPVAIDKETFIKIEWTKFIECLLADKRTRFEYEDKVLNKTFNIKKTASIMSIILLKDD